ISTLTISYLHSFPTRRSSDLIPLRNRFKKDQNIHMLLTFSDNSHLSPLSVKRQLTSFKAILTAKCKLRSREWQLEQIQLHAEKRDRKSTRLNSSHQIISYAVF